MFRPHNGHARHPAPEGTLRCLVSDQYNELTHTQTTFILSNRKAVLFDAAPRRTVNLKRKVRRARNSQKPNQLQISDVRVKNARRNKVSRWTTTGPVPRTRTSLIIHLDVLFLHTPPPPSTSLCSSVEQPFSVRDPPNRGRAVNLEKEI